MKWFWHGIATVTLVGMLPMVARAQAESADDHTKIVAGMQVATGQLKRLDTGQPTQNTQKQIVASLDDLIARLEKECEACRGAKRPDPSRPMNDSMIRKGPGGMGDLHAAQKEGKNWGELPAHERDRILQSMTEGFPVHYQRILERYYKRLAQEAPAGGESKPADSATDRPATEPAAGPAPAEKPPAAGSEK